MARRAIIRDEVVGPAAKQAIFGDTAARLPTKRVGTPKEIADAVLFVISNAYVTGAVIRVDGGYIHV